MGTFVTRGGTSLHFVEQGVGPPLLFLHGWAMSGQIWRLQTEAFAPACRVIVPDLRGHGQSAMGPESLFGLEALACDLIELVELLALERISLVCWSLGALVALAAFPQLQQRVAALALVGATPRFTAGDGYPYGLPACEVRGMGLRLRRDFRKTMGEFFWEMFMPGELSLEQETRIAREILLPSSPPLPEAALTTLNILATTDLRTMLPTVDRPVLLAHGTADPICPPGAPAFLAKALPDATLHLFDGLGHAPFLSRPDQFNRLLADFLKVNHDRD